MTKFYKTTLLISLVFFMNSCCTEKLWEETRPEYWLSKEVISEKELIEKNVNYKKEADGFFIEKPPLNKIGDYTLRVIGTPITAVADTIIFGGLFILVNCSNSKMISIEMKPK